MTVETLINGCVILRFEDCTNASGIHDRMRRFFTPFFWQADTETVVDPTPDLTIVYRSAEAFDDTLMRRLAEDLTIRRSSAEVFNLVVRTGRDEKDRVLAWDPIWRTGYRIDASKRRVEFFASETSFIHLVELVRYYGLLVEQSRGTVLLHASGTIAEGAEEPIVTAICGPKGAGKTTTMLFRVLDGGDRYFSGDKLLLTEGPGGVPMVRGWPDYPHVGVGSLSGFPDFARRVGAARVDAEGRPLSPGHKLLFDPVEYYAHMPMTTRPSARLGAVLLPKVQAERPLRRELADWEKTLERLGPILEFPHTFITATWHGMRPDGLLTDAVPESLLERLCALPWVEHHGVLTPRSAEPARGSDAYA